MAYVITRDGKPVTCDWCPNVATRVSRDASDELLCEATARDHYPEWRTSTTPIGPRTLALRAPSIAPLVQLRKV